MQKPTKYTAFAVLILLLILAVATGWTLKVLNLPPITGHISDKDRHPAYYPATLNTPEVFVLAITDDSGNRCVSWRVSEERWHLYEVGDDVTWWPRWKEEQHESF